MCWRIGFMVTMKLLRRGGTEALDLSLKKCGQKSGHIVKRLSLTAGYV